MDCLGDVLRCPAEFHRHNDLGDERDPLLADDMCTEDLVGFDVENDRHDAFRLAECFRFAMFREL